MKCDSLPRERAIMQAIDKHCPDWNNLAIHESSPIMRRASVRIIKEAKNYTESQFFVGKARGEKVEGIQNIDLEDQVYADGLFDLVITQDIFEHLYHPEKAFADIHRTLKIGGMHIMTVPIENKFSPTIIWAELDENGTNRFMHKPEYHGNPVDNNGSAVTWHYGFDIVDLIKKSIGDGVQPIITTWEDTDNGIKGELMEVIVIKKE